MRWKRMRNWADWVGRHCGRDEGKQRKQEMKKMCRRMHLLMRRVDQELDRDWEEVSWNSVIFEGRVVHLAILVGKIR